MTAAFSLSRNSFGRLVFTTASGTIHEGVVPVRAFPIGDPEGGLALVATDGRELAWMENLSQLTGNTRALIEEELAAKDFMPEILRIRSVSSFATPSTWVVETDRGETSFILMGEEDIRHLAANALLIADNHGIHFLIRDLQALDKPSRKIIDRFR